MTNLSLCGVGPIVQNLNLRILSNHSFVDRRSRHRSRYLIAHIMASRLSSLRLLESYLEDLESLVEEINRLEGVDAEANAYELNKSLSKITKFLERNDDGYVLNEMRYHGYERIATNHFAVRTMMS